MKLPPENAQLVPDQPLAIGYKCSWFAVKDISVPVLAALFGFDQLRGCNWAHGVAAAREDNIFISPPVQGWRLILGRQLPFADTALALEAVAALLVQASRLAGEAQFFATHRVVEFHCWMKARAGTLERGYAYLGDHGEVMQDVGARTSSEPADLLTATSLALELLNENDDAVITYPDEELVMAIAAAWSIDPNAPALSNELPALGVLGTVLR